MTAREIPNSVRADSWATCTTRTAARFLPGAISHACLFAASHAGIPWPLGQKTNPRGSTGLAEMTQTCHRRSRFPHLPWRGGSGCRGPSEDLGAPPATGGGLTPTRDRCARGSLWLRRVSRAARQHHGALQLRPDATEPVLVDGVWISPGEIQFVNAESAKPVRGSRHAEARERVRRYPAAPQARGRATCRGRAETVAAEASRQGVEVVGRECRLRAG